MRVHTTSPHLHFLSSAAHLLAHSAPETSAFLTRRRTEVLLENAIPLPAAHRQHACTSCGHLLIPGQRATTLTLRPAKAAAKPSRAQRRKAPLPTTTPSRGGVAKVLACGRCTRKTVLALDAPGRISRSCKDGGVSKAKAAAVAGEPAKSANASSKKRAKNRKAGLQALLDQKRDSATSAGFGLSLADFMKK